MHASFQILIWLTETYGLTGAGPVHICEGGILSNGRNSRISSDVEKVLVSAGQFPQTPETTLRRKALAARGPALVSSAAFHFLSFLSPLSPCPAFPPLPISQRLRAHPLGLQKSHMRAFYCAPAGSAQLSLDFFLCPSCDFLSIYLFRFSPPWGQSPDLLLFVYTQITVHQPV